MLDALRKYSIVLSKPIFHILIVVCVGILSYANSFHVPFFFDDYAIESIVEGFDPWMVFEGRYVTNLSFFVNYKLHGYNVFGYHAVNIVIHLINAVFTYRFILLLFRAQSQLYKNSAVTDARHSEIIAFATAIVFVSHPLQLQAVTLVIQRYASLATLFYLLTLIVYLKWRMLTVDNSLNVNFKYVALYVLALIIAFIASITKQTAVTLPIMITIVEFMFFSGKHLKRLLHCIPFYAVILVVSYLAFAVFANSKFDEIDDMMLKRLDSGLIVLDRWQNLFTQFRVIITYIRMLFIPVNLTLIYDYPVSFSFWQSRVYISLIVLSAIFSFAIYLYHLAQKKHDIKHADFLFISFGILWFFISIAPQSSIIPLSNWQLMEYRVYLPSVGFFTAVITALFMIAQAVNPKKLTAYFTLPILTISLVFAVATYKRNSLYQSEVTLYEDNVKKVPTSIFAHINLASAYIAAGEIDKAISALQKAKSLNPLFGLTHYTMTQTLLASVYTQKGNYAEAARELKETLHYEPDNADLHTRLGLVYVKQELLNDAAEEFKAAIMLSKNLVDPHYYLGAIYANQGRFDDALRQWRHVVRLKPDQGNIYIKIGDIYMLQDKPEEALKEYNTALNFEKNNAAIYLKICDVYKRLGREADSARVCQTALQADTKDVKDAALYLKLGLMHENQGNLDEAARQYSMAIKLDPKSAEAHNNLGVVLGKQGKIDDAFNEISKAINIRPDYADAHNNLGLCLRLQGKTDKAKEEFTAALKIDPNHRGAKGNLESLK